MATLDWIWYLDGKQCSHPASLLERFGRRPGTDELPLWERANSVECPIGPDPGSAWLLVERTRFNSLSKSGFHTIKIVNPTESVTLQGYVFIRALSMFGLPGDANSPMLVELQDRRAVVAKSAINKGYNVRIPAPPNPATVANRYYPESLDGQSPWTWKRLVADIWGMLADAGLAPTIPATPVITENPDCLRFYGGNAWYALHAALSVVGLTTAFDPVADEFSIIRPGADPALAARLTTLRSRLKQTFDPPQNVHAGLIPEKIKVYFAKRDLYHGIERDTPRIGNWEAAPVYEIQLATGIAGARGTLPINGDLYAAYDAKGNLTNLAELTKRANDILASVKANLGLDRGIWIAGATALLVPGSELTKVTWRDYGDDSGQITIAERNIPLPKSSGGGEMSPEFDSVKPTDIGRRSHPVYPRLMQVVQIYDQQAQTKALHPVQGTVGTKSVYLHKARVKLVRDGMETLEACFVLVAKDFDNLNGQASLNNYSYWHGRLSGVATIGQTTLPLYSVELGLAAGRIGFKMTGPRLRLRQSDGTRYGTATAIVEWIVGDVPVSVGDSVTVNFPGIRWAEAVKNCEGEADYFSSYSTPAGIVSEDIYVVTECQGLPLRIAFVTLEDRNPFAPDQDVKAVPVYAYGAAQDDLPIEDWYQVSQGSGEVDCGEQDIEWIPNANNPHGGYWEQTSPGDFKICCLPNPLPPPPQDPTQTGITAKLGGIPTSQCDPPTQQPDFYVRYPQLKWPRALEGADGLAKLDNAAWSDDPADMRYVVVVANQQSTRIKGTLPGDNCGSSFALASVEVCDFWPFSQKPKLQQTIQNTHKGFSGYWWWASWNETLQAYEVRDMKKTTMFVGSVGSSTDQQGCTTIVSSYREVDLETCKQPTSEVLLQYRSESKKFLKKLRYEKNEVTTGSGQDEVTNCQPVLYSEWDQANVLTLCTGSSTGEDFINLAVERVVRQIVGADGCLYQVFTELIVWGQCGDDTPAEDPLLCVAPWVCPDGSGSGQ